MENFYLIAVALLFLLAIFDLIVGVSNDAVNFLNSAIGSKVARRRTIMLVASAGILIGAITSGGMMEVARKGIFNPQHFYFDEVMVIFLAVMITDIILLDLFNTLAMPTSTTVSIVFEILGAAFALSIIKIMQKGSPMNYLFNLNDSDAGIVGFMNWSKAGEIILGIFLSVIFAFAIGAIVQFLSRWLFSFEYQKRMKTVGIFWCALAFTFMFYFLVFKGLKSTYKEISIPEKEFIQYVQLNNYQTKANLNQLPTQIKVKTKKAEVEFNKTSDKDGQTVYKGLFGSKAVKGVVKQIYKNLWSYAFVFFLGISLLLFVLKFLRVNYLRLVVLFGTFCLAMAFAGNDLVNFIGIPVAGVQSFDLFSGALESDPNLLANEFQMFSLKFPQETPFTYLAFAGIVMILTLWFSKKSRSVTETEVNLGSQSDVKERFQPNFLARIIVNFSSKTNQLIGRILPKSLNQDIERKFVPTVDLNSKNKPAFDLVRASVNLAIASVLIAIATNMKLPLSTTYVSFMVAMGTSLADRAWGRESAVYRVAGVLNVIGGWFLTAIIAMTAAGIFASFMYFGKLPAVIVMVAIVGLLIFRSSKYHQKTLTKKKRLQNKSKLEFQHPKEALQEITKELSMTLRKVNQTIQLCLEALQKEDKQLTKQAMLTYQNLAEEVEVLSTGLFKLIKQNPTKEHQSPKLFVLSFDLLHEILESLQTIAKTSNNHVLNNHKALDLEQIQNLKEIENQTQSYFNMIQNALQENQFGRVQEVETKKDAILARIEELLSKQIQDVNQLDYGFKNTTLYFGFLLEIKDIVAISARFIKMLNRVENNENLI